MIRRVQYQPQDPLLDPRKTIPWSRIMLSARLDADRRARRRRNRRIRLAAMLAAPVFACAGVAAWSVKAEAEARLAEARAVTACSRSMTRLTDAYDKAVEAYGRGRARADMFDETIDLDALFDAVKEPPVKPVTRGCPPATAGRNATDYRVKAKGLDAYSRRITTIIGNEA